jgi:hypothetical protein
MAMTKRQTPEQRANYRYAMYRWSYKHKNRTTDGMMTRPEWEAWHVSQGKDTGRPIDLRRRLGPRPDEYSKLRFYRHRAQAKYRKISFEFTWEEWHAWWLSHGIDRNIPSEERGAQRLCMCRYKDIGPYAPDNVYLATLAQNSSDAKRSESQKRGGRPKGSKNKPKNT